MAPAALSVTREFEERVREEPQKCLSRVRTSSSGRPSTCWRKLRVRESEAGPMPSETMKMRLRLPSAGLGNFVELLCWVHTARTMRAAVARRAQTKRTISRRREGPGGVREESSLSSPSRRSLMRGVRSEDCAFVVLAMMFKHPLRSLRFKLQGFLRPRFVFRLMMEVSLGESFVVCLPSWKRCLGPLLRGKRKQGRDFASLQFLSQVKLGWLGS